jgi:hypothetical protein
MPSVRNKSRRRSRFPRVMSTQHQMAFRTLAVPHRGNYELFRLGKLRSLCAECHNALDAPNRAPVRSRSPVRANGTPSDPRHPWNVVQPPK